MLNNTVFSRTITCGTRSMRKSNKTTLTKSLSQDRETKKKNKERKKRHSFSFGFFSDKTSPEDSSDRKQLKQHFNRTSDDKRSSSPTHIGHHSTNTHLPELTKETYQYCVNSSFERAAMFGQLDEPPATNGNLFQKRRNSPSSSRVESTVIPRILINGKEWDGQTRDRVYTEMLYDEDEEDIITRGTQVEECMAGGMGLSEGFVNAENTFFIETDTPFDNCKLKVDIKGPKQNPIKINSFLLDVNLCSYSYWPRRVGYYLISVQWKGKHITGSPFDVSITLNKPALSKNSKFEK